MSRSLERLKLLVMFNPKTAYSTVENDINVFYKWMGFV